MRLTEEEKYRRISIAVKYRSGTLSAKDAAETLGVSKTAFSSMVYYHSDEIQSLCKFSPNVCEHCSLRLPSRLAYSMHRVQAHGVSPDTCAKCGALLTGGNILPGIVRSSNYVCRPCNRMYYNHKNAEVRRKVLKHYGGKCACCGEVTDQFLTVDHVNNDGGEHRKEIGIRRGGNAFYRWLVRHNFPEGFQILCWNCQEAKQIYGVCPHANITKEERQ